METKNFKETVAKVANNIFNYFIQENINKVEPFELFDELETNGVDFDEIENGVLDNLCDSILSNLKEMCKMSEEIMYETIYETAYDGAPNDYDRAVKMAWLSFDIDCEGRVSVIY